MERKQNLLIKVSMLPQCRVAVLMPVFNESVDTALMPLLSLARQKWVEKNHYEIIFIVSNSERKALKRVPEFLENQKIIALVKYINSPGDKPPYRLIQSQQKKIAEIRNSGLILHVMDKSSPSQANEFDSANLARNLAAKEICKRFLTVPIRENGVIAMTDCDCRFSENYISELIATFKIPGVNRVAGKWLTETLRGLPFREFVSQAVAIHLTAETSFSRRARSKIRLALVYQNSKTPVRISGQNLAVSVRAFSAVGGIKSNYSFADIIFGYQVSHLPGKTVFNPNFWVCTLIRVSDRVGVISLGRRVKTIVESIDNFVAGKTDNIYIPDRKKISGLFTKIFADISRARLDKNILLGHLDAHGVKRKHIDDADIDRFLKLLAEEPDGKVGEDGVNRVEKLLLSKFYQHLPKKMLSLSGLDKIND